MSYYKMSLKCIVERDCSKYFCFLSFGKAIFVSFPREKINWLRDHWKGVLTRETLKAEQQQTCKEKKSIGWWDINAIVYI